GNLALVQMIVYAGGDVGATTRLGGYTPLHLAAKNGRADVVEALLKAGANAQATTASGATALMLAAAAGSTPAVQTLLAHGADVNARETAKGETALMFAAAFNRAETVAVLLQHGADVKATTRVLDWTKLAKNDPRLPSFGRRAPSTTPAAGARPGAAAPGGKPAVKPVEASTQAAEPADEEPDTVEPGAAARPAGIPGEKKDGARKAKSQAAAFDFTGGYVKLVGTQGGLTALEFATRQGNTESVRALLAGGADLNEVNPADHTSPLLSAIINGHFDLAEELLAKGADPNLAQANGVTPLYAVLNCVWAPRTLYPQPTAYKQQQTTYLQLMKDLLDHGAKPNARLKEKVWYSGYNFDQSGVDEAGATPFWRAAYADDIAAMKLLMSHGADPAIATKKPAGRRPTGTGNLDDEAAAKAKRDPSGRPPVAVGGPDVTPLLAASGEAYGSSFTANHHRYAPTGMLAAVKYLVEELHADVNEADADGNTALHNAAARGDNEMILYLVSRGADVKAVNRKGQTVPDLANGPVQRISPFPETIALLQKMGARLVHKCLSCG
ncbi:MAG: ankyrin repeat domain-containing protein, partial [Acidobacteriota bacterium]|nr:ankyrin repeat domain-containing protein [Acidobacteriota bacterium]